MPLLVLLGYPKAATNCTLNLKMLLLYFYYSNLHMMKFVFLESVLLLNLYYYLCSLNLHVLQLMLLEHCIQMLLLELHESIYICFFVCS
jgi:hypothetical protein